MVQRARNIYHWISQVRGKFRKEITYWVLQPILRVYYRLCYRHLASPSKVITVNVTDINGWYTGNRYDEYTFQGQISGGDWNPKIIPIEKVYAINEKYISMEQRFLENKPWKKTDLFKERFAQKLEHGISVYGKTSIDELADYYHSEVDQLYEKIKKNGILPGNNKEIDPIYIMINADGEMLYTVDGNHRLAICRVLGIKQMPVQVWKRHKKWQAIRDQVLSASHKEDLPNHLKQYLDHPDIRSELEILYPI